MAKIWISIHADADAFRPIVELVLDRLSTKQLVNADVLTLPHAQLVNQETRSLVSVVVQSLHAQVDKLSTSIPVNADALSPAIASEPP